MIKIQAAHFHTSFYTNNKKCSGFPLSFPSLNKKMDSKTSRTKIKLHVEKLNKDIHSSFNHVVLC